MFELVYRSTSKNNINNDDISIILKSSRVFNSKNDITGCLLYHNHEFIQIIEGEEKIVRELYARIEKNPMHDNIILLNESNINSKAFGSWSMAYYQLGSDDIKNIMEMLFINNFVTLADLVEKPTHALKLFWYISKQLLLE